MPLGEGSRGLAGNIQVRVLDAQDYDKWDKFVAAAPGGSIYALPGYLEILSSVTDATFRIAVAERGGEILAGIGLYERRDRVGPYVAPRLLLYYNGPVFSAPRSKYPSENTSLHLKIVDALDDWLADQEYDYVRVKSRGDLTDVRPFQERGWAVELAYTYEVALTDGDAVFDRIESNYRRLIRRCERDGFRVESDDDFDSFFRLHSEVHERKDAPLYLPREAFHDYFEQLNDRGLARLYHARLPDGTAAASQLVLLGPHSIAHTVAAGTAAEHLRTGASVLLRWKVFEDLMNDGYTGNDLTDAALGDVTRFKSRLGGDLRLSLVLTRPPSTRWRARQQAEAGVDFTRRAAGYAARRLGVRKS